jgi:hypothetical protein
VRAAAARIEKDGEIGVMRDRVYTKTLSFALQDAILQVVSEYPQASSQESGYF